MSLLGHLKADDYEEELMRLTCADAQLGRMSMPVPAVDCDLTDVRVQPRFSVEQGLRFEFASRLCPPLCDTLFFCRPDGSTKVRPVDHFSYSAEGGRSRKKRKASSVNGHTAVPEQIVHDHLDDLAEAMRLFLKQNGAPPSLWKLDVDSAFRRVPLAKEHQWAAAVAFKYRGQVSELLCALLRRSLRLFLHLHETYVSTHKSSPFGATSSVHTWERVGAAMAVFARRLLHLPVLRYVDDYFSLDRSSKRHTARFSLHLGYVLQAGVRRARHALHGQVGASSAWSHGSGRAKNGVWPEAGDPWDSGGTWC